jgi:hypothetical protein
LYCGSASMASPQAILVIFPVVAPAALDCAVLEPELAELPQALSATARPADAIAAMILRVSTLFLTL